MQTCNLKKELDFWPILWSLALRSKKDPILKDSRTEKRFRKKFECASARLFSFFMTAGSHGELKGREKCKQNFGQESARGIGYLPNF